MCLDNIFNCFYASINFFRINNLLGGHRERVTPGSISNPEVKPLIANGTALLPEWESRAPPGFFYVLLKIAFYRSMKGAIK